MNSIRTLKLLQFPFITSAFRTALKPPSKFTIFQVFIAGFFVHRYIKSRDLKAIAYSKPEIAKPNEFVDLSRLDYYERVLGNTKDYFFFIIYDEPEVMQAVKAAKQLKTIVDSKKYQGFNVYIMNRNTLDKINQIMDKADHPIPFNQNKKSPIEIYLKTPHSNDYMSFKFNANRFFTERSLKKYGKTLTKLKNLIEVVNDEEELLDRLFYSSQKFGEVLIIRCAEDPSSKESQKRIEDYAKTAYFCLEKKLLSIKSSFILITDKKLIEKYGLDKDHSYVYRNDVIQAYESIYGKNIEDKSGYLRIENPNLSNYGFYLDKLPPSPPPIIFESTEDKKVVRRREDEENSRFVDFVTDRIMLLKNMKNQSIGKAIRKSIRDRSKYTISLYLPKSDPQHEKKLHAFMELYRKYKDKFTFLLIEKDFMQDLLPHVNTEFSDFVAYNIIHQYKGYEQYKNYYKGIINPYRKFFLRPSAGSPFSFEELEENVQKFLKGELPEVYLNATEGAVQTLKSEEIKTLIEYSKRMQKPVLLDIYDRLRATQGIEDALRGVVGDTLKKPTYLDEKGMLVAKIDQPNAVRFLGDMKPNTLLFYNPKSDSVLIAPFSAAKGSEETKEWINNFISANFP